MRSARAAELLLLFSFMVITINTHHFLRFPFDFARWRQSSARSALRKSCDLMRKRKTKQKKQLDLREGDRCGAAEEQQPGLFYQEGFFGFQSAPSWLSLSQQRDGESPDCCWYSTAERPSSGCASCCRETARVVPEMCRNGLQNLGTNTRWEKRGETFSFFHIRDMFVFVLTQVAMRKNNGKRPASIRPTTFIKMYIIV